MRVTLLAARARLYADPQRALDVLSRVSSGDKTVDAQRAALLSEGFARTGNFRSADVHLKRALSIAVDGGPKGRNSGGKHRANDVCRISRGLRPTGCEARARVPDADLGEARSTYVRSAIVVSFIAPPDVHRRLEKCLCARRLAVTKRVHAGA